MSEKQPSEAAKAFIRDCREACLWPNTLQADSMGILFDKHTERYRKALEQVRLYMYHPLTVHRVAESALAAKTHVAVEGVNCPQCGKSGGEPVQDEVDIGVGVQIHMRGYECPTCGQMTVCSGCGHWDFKRAEACVVVWVLGAGARGGGEVSMNPLIGKTITNIWLADDEGAIKFDLSDGTSVVAQCDGDCCSDTWIEDVIDADAVIGAVVTDASDIELPAHLRQPTKTTHGEEEMEYYGFEIRTAQGRCVLAYRNSSNGYYGGSLSWPGADHYGGVYNQNMSTQKWKAVQK